MASASKEYRECASECLDWARTARSDRERLIFLQMARAWILAVAQADLRSRRESAPPPDAIETDSSAA
jgi:hypothetical protein